MKVVLLKDIRDMGKAGTVHEVSDGHAMNMLIPRKLAVLATSATVKKAEEIIKAQKERKVLDQKLIADRLTALAEERVVIRKKTNEQGHLYDGVDAKDIALATQLPEEAISLERPFKEVGTYHVPVSLGENFGSLTVIIEAE
jgi:large subunit ribosomal protein L9